MPRNAAAVRLNALIDALPSEPAIKIPGETIAADLVALLPRDEKLNVRSPHNVVAAARSRQTHILMAFSTFLILYYPPPSCSHLFCRLGPETVSLSRRLAVKLLRPVRRVDEVLRENPSADKWRERSQRNSHSARSHPFQMHFALTGGVPHTE